MTFKTIWKNWGVLISLSVIYLVTHLIGLAALPIFADESIYIRWAQLIVDEPTRYAFFPLNDGKTPLFIWLLVPLQLLFADQLVAGRVLSVLIGLVQVWAMVYLVKLLTKSTFAQVLAGAATIFLPFWFFHHRMVLMDGLLTLALTSQLIWILHLIKVSAVRKKILFAGLAGVSFGLALWAKLPAVLAAPPLGLAVLLTPVLQTSKKTKKLESRRLWTILIRESLWVGASFGLGGLIFISLALHPAFPQLFSRGSDFLWPWREVVFNGVWQQTVTNFPTYLQYFGRYVGFIPLLVMLIGLFSPDKKRRALIHYFFWASLIFIGPIALLGKVVYPRYLMPAMLWITVTLALAFDSLKVSYLDSIKHRGLQLVVGLLFALALVNSINQSALFMITSWVEPNAIPFVPADREQYLLEWSSGHGIAETVALIRTQAESGSVAVATEGSFGTLPDGLLVYFHGTDVENIYVEGIGYPVKSLTQPFVNRAGESDQVWLVVNSHRLEMELGSAELVAEYCRPFEAACLQVWNITDQLESLPVRDQL